MTNKHIELPALSDEQRSDLLRCARYFACDDEDREIFTSTEECRITNLLADLAAHEQARVVGEPVAWMPIETAPKDGGRCLWLARFNTNGELVEIDFDGIWGEWSESLEGHVISKGYEWLSANGIEEPTHWAYQYGAPPIASLPAPKAAQAEQKPLRWQWASSDGVKLFDQDWKPVHPHETPIFAAPVAQPATEQAEAPSADIRHPMRTAPSMHADYWRLTPTGGWLYTWTGSGEDFDYMRNGLAFATREALQFAQYGSA